MGERHEAWAKYNSVQYYVGNDATAEELREATKYLSALAAKVAARAAEQKEPT